MKKIFNKISLVLLLLLLVFSACNGEQNQPHQHSLEELGETIEAAGEFWNKWWASHYTFEWAHIDDSRRNWQPWDEAITPAHHPLSRGFAIILPSSGFANLDDIASHLSQFYTQDWLDRRQFSEPEVSMKFMENEYVTLFGFYGFEEYDGELFVFIQVEWTQRPDWAGAVHTLIEQEGNRAVVETVVQSIRYRFILIDGKIDSGYGQWE